MKDDRETRVRRIVGDVADFDWESVAPLDLAYRGPLHDGGIGPAETPPPACARWHTTIRLATSSTALHVRFAAQDRVLSATHETDGSELWKEDVFEIFLWPDDEVPAYFEYELSPLGIELPLMVLNTGESFHGWSPWPYDAATQVQKTVEVRANGLKVPGRSGQRIDEWCAEITIPYALLKPVGHRAPSPGEHWRANFYRIDYDDGQPRVWSWRPTTRNFHEPDRFGTLVFG